MTKRGHLKWLLAVGIAIVITATTAGVLYALFASKSDRPGAPPLESRGTAATLESPVFQSGPGGHEIENDEHLHQSKVTVSAAHDLAFITDKTKVVRVVCEDGDLDYSVIKRMKVPRVELVGHNCTVFTLDNVVHDKLEALVLKDCDALSAKDISVLKRASLITLHIGEMASFDGACLDVLSTISTLADVSFPEGRIQLKDIQRFFSKAALVSFSMHSIDMSTDEIGQLRFPKTLSTVSLLGLRNPPGMLFAQAFEEAAGVTTLGLTLRTPGLWIDGVLEECLNRLSLKDLLIGAKLGTKDVVALSNEKSLQTLSALCIEKLDDAWFENVGKLPALLGLRLVKCLGASKRALGYLASSTTLEELELHECSPTLDEQVVKEVTGLAIIVVTRKAQPYLDAFYIQ